MSNKITLRKSEKKGWKPLNEIQMVKIYARNIKGTCVVSSAKKGNRLIIA